MHMIDMRKPFEPDTKSQIELRHHHALNYIATRMGEIELHLGKIAAHLEATSFSAGDVAKAIRDVGAPVRTMKK